MGGFLEELEALGVEAVPLVSAWAVSAGPVEDSAFESLVSLLLQQIEKEQLRRSSGCASRCLADYVPALRRC